MLPTALAVQNVRTRFDDLSARRDRLRGFLAANFLLSDEPFPYGDHESLFGNGVIDSTGVPELIEFLESQLDTPVADDEATRANFDSIAAILRFVAMKHPRKEAC